MTSHSHPLEGAKTVRGQKLIELTGGAYAKVDADDYARVAGRSWHLVNINGCQYAAHTARVPLGRKFVYRKVFLHREVLGAAGGVQVRFKSKDRLDCRKANLSARPVKQWGSE